MGMVTVMRIAANQTAVLMPMMPMMMMMTAARATAATGRAT